MATSVKSLFALALLLLALGIGEGAHAQAPLARVVLGGLAASTVITLFLIPAVYAVTFRGPEILPLEASQTGIQDSRASL